MSFRIVDFGNENIAVGLYKKKKGRLLVKTLRSQRRTYFSIYKPNSMSLRRGRFRLANTEFCDKYFVWKSYRKIYQVRITMRYCRDICECRSRTLKKIRCNCLNIKRRKKLCYWCYRDVYDFGWFFFFLRILSYWTDIEPFRFIMSCEHTRQYI